MSIETDIRKHLITVPQLTNFVGERIMPYPLKPDSNGKVIPGITYMKLNPNRVKTHGGHSGLSHPIIQFSSWSYQWDECRAIADNLISYMDEFSGLMNGRPVYASFVNSETVIFDPDTQLYHIPVDFEIYLKSE